MWLVAEVVWHISKIKKIIIIHMKINQNLFEFRSVLEFQVFPKEPLDISSVMLTVEGSSL